MKRVYRFFILLGFILNIPALCTFAQVSINADSSAPDLSAGLDVKFNNKGFLPPRMTFAGRNAIQNPVEGLIVYCTNCNADGAGVISIYQGGKWQNILWGCTMPLAPVEGTHIPEVTQIIWNWNSVPIAIGYKWNTTSNFTTATDIGFSTSYTETGLTCQSPYTRYVWAYNACGQSSELTLSQSTSQIPFSPAPTEGVHIPSINQIVWTWNPVLGATGYKWNTTDNFATATFLGLDTSKTETGLICNTAYTRYLWAYNACGNSISTMLAQTTSVNPTPPIAGTHVPSAFQIVWKWNPVSGATGYKWNTIDEYASATDMGAALTKTETGLAMNTAYTRFVWAYNTCGMSSTASLICQTNQFYIGQSYGGGIIFYIDVTGQHGLISATTNQSAAAKWGCPGTSIAGTSTAIGSGQANTTAIVNGCTVAGIAARICNDLVLNGYDDWFLPSKDELYQMYLQKNLIGGFVSNYYWSSSEYNASNAWYVYFGNGIQGNDGKNYTNYVRAVRAF
ncbi:MAG: DUF1566 domain-containing protein [Bacteroidetes bacterium]|nr:DUF1566 domain-containing protein [Bacteroidota bacterium]